MTGKHKSQTSRGKGGPLLLRAFAGLIGKIFAISPVQTVLWSICDIFHAACSVAVVIFSQQLFDAVENWAGTGSVRGLILPFAGFALALVVLEAVNGLSNFRLEYRSPKILKALHHQLQRKASMVSPADYEQTDFLNMLQGAKNGLEQGFRVAQFILTVFTFYLPYFIFMGLYLRQLSPLLIFLILLIFLPVIGGQVVRYRWFGKTEDEAVIWRRRESYFEKVLCSRDTVKEIRTLGVFHYFMDKYRHGVGVVTDKLKSTARRQLRLDLVLSTLTVLGYIGILLLLVWEMLAGRITVGSFAAVFGGVTSMYMYAREVFVGIFRNITRNAFAVGNYQRFLEYEPSRPGPGSVELRYPKENDTEALGTRIILDHVSFAYPNQEKYALEDISLTLSPGESIALVGENGAGKTTLARLILGLYSPVKGRIIYELPRGTPKDKDPDHPAFPALKNCSAVFQNYQRYPMSLKDNVVISDHERQKDWEHIPQICASVGLDLEAGSFPLGIDTMLYTEFGGVDLSGGQWQRVAMSRGLFREHEIIILDEPTAAIDPIEEAALYKTFARISKEKLSVIVTHRLGSAKIADRILVLKDGKLLDMGSHDTLMGRCSYYRELYQAQAKWYK